MMRSADAPERLGPVGAQLMRFATTSALQVSCARSARGVGVACGRSVGRMDSEQAASVAAERIRALRRFRMTSLDGVEEERGRNATPLGAQGKIEPPSTGGPMVVWSVRFSRRGRSSIFGGIQLFRGVPVDSGRGC